MSIVSVTNTWISNGVSIKGETDSKEAIIKANLNYEVAKQNLRTEGGTPVPGKFATVRIDKDIPLGVVGRRYKVIQNTDSFSAFDNVIGRGSALYEMAGDVGSGEIIWILAKMPGSMMIVKDDMVEKYITLLNRHDGQASFQMMLTPIRTVGGATLNVSVNGTPVSSQSMSCRHTSGALRKIAEIEEFMRNAVDHYILFESKAKALAGKQVNTALRNKFLEILINRIYKDPNAKKSRSRATDTRIELERLMDFGQGTTIPGVKGTAWGAFNAVAEYADFYRQTRKSHGSTVQTQRSKSLLFGDSRALKQFAFDKISEMVGLK